MASSWGCPHEIDGRCTRVNNLPCDPGRKGCVLAGRFVFVDESKNLREKQTSENKDNSPASDDESKP